MGLYLIETFPVGPLQCNCAIVADPTTPRGRRRRPRATSPTASSRRSPGAGLQAVALVHTHAHFDHVGCSALLKRITGAPILMHAGDRPLYQNLAEQGQTFGLTLDAPGIIDRTPRRTGTASPAARASSRSSTRPATRRAASASGWRARTATCSSPATPSFGARSGARTSGAARRRRSWSRSASSS